jgi:glycosyltransferase involved in cell wall biosynthesis
MGAPRCPGIPKHRPIVGYLGTLHPRKRAAAWPDRRPILARVPSARFLVVGDGPERAALEAACARLGVAGRFAFAGQTPRVGPLLRRMDVLAHPSMNEGASNAILEAMAAGVPVVAYAVSGNLETVFSGETGTLVPDGREDDFAAAVAALLEDPDEARRLGTGGAPGSSATISVDAMVRATAAVYDEAIA